jgi:hypothetical protein
MQQSMVPVSLCKICFLCTWRTGYNDRNPAKPDTIEVLIQPQDRAYSNWDLGKQALLSQCQNKIVHENVFNLHKYV